MALSCGYEVDDDGEVGNINEDELDTDWRFPLPQAEVQAQLRHLHELASEGIRYPEEEFWHSRTERDIEASGENTNMTEDDDRAETHLEASDEENQEMTEVDDEGEFYDDGTLGSPESATTPSSTQPDPNSEDRDDGNDDTLS